MACKHLCAVQRWQQQQERNIQAAAVGLNDNQWIIGVHAGQAAVDARTREGCATCNPCVGSKPPEPPACVLGQGRTARVSPCTSSAACLPAWPKHSRPARTHHHCRPAQHSTPHQGGCTACVWCASLAIPGQVPLAAARATTTGTQLSQQCNHSALHHRPDTPSPPPPLSPALPSSATQPDLTSSGLMNRLQRSCDVNGS